MHVNRLAVVALFSVATTTGCASNTKEPKETAATCDVPVDRFKELEIVDDGVIGDLRSKNASDGPWSFRHAVEAMVPPNVAPGDFVLAWLTDWATRQTQNGIVL